MLAPTVLGALGALCVLFLVYYVFPVLWLHLISVDDSLDSCYATQTLVASRLCPLYSKDSPILNFPPLFPIPRESVPRNGTPSKYGKTHPPAAQGACLLA